MPMRAQPLRTADAFDAPGLPDAPEFTDGRTRPRQFVA
jgi:hypothetical protein